jgi:hypothetical protein
LSQEGKMKKSDRVFRTCILAASTATMLFSISNAAVIPSGIPAGYTGKVFTGDTLKGHAQQIPGVIKVVFFDEGGEGVGFHDADAGNVNTINHPNSMRTINGVQIQADYPVEMQAFDSFWDWTVLNTPETLGSWHESWTNLGEWTKHTVKVLTAGTYSIDIHAACVDAANSISLTFNNAAPVLINNLPNVLPSQVHPGSENWHIWNRFKDVATVDLDTGLYVLKQQFVQGGWNFDKIIFKLKTTTQTKQTAYGNAAAGPPELNIVLSGDVLKLSYNRTGPGDSRISLVNCAGKTIASSIESRGVAGLQSCTFNLRTVGRGVYFVEVEQNGLREVRSLTTTR